MQVLEKKERCLAVSNWVDKNIITRFLLSPISVSFVYGIFLFAYEIFFLREIIPAIHPVLIAWTGIVVAYNALIRKNILSLKGMTFLILFAVASLVTVVLNWKAGIFGNVKVWILSLLPIFAFLPVCQTVSKENRKKVLIKVLLGASVVILLASLVSLYLYLIRFGGTLRLFGLEHNIGLRLYDPQRPDSGVLLYGIYCDPNHAAMYAIAFATYSLVLLLECRKGLFKAKWQNVLGIVYASVSLLVNICYFPLANSRGGWLCLAIACVIVVFLYVYNSPINKGKLVRSVISFALAIAITAGVCGLIIGARAAMAGLSEVVVNGINSSSSTKPPAGNLPSTNPPSTKPSIDNQLGEDVKWEDFEKDNDSFGAGRIELWKDSFKLLVKRPIFGECPGNNQHYAILYGFKNKIAEGKALHNSYLDLLVSYGLVGFVLMIAFWALCLITVLKKMANKKLKTDFSYYIISIAVVMTAGVICFLSCAFINTTAMYYVMLIMAGYLIAPQETSDELPIVDTEKDASVSSEIK